jgi:hypothetical protein
MPERRSHPQPHGTGRANRFLDDMQATKEYRCSSPAAHFSYVMELEVLPLLPEYNERDLVEGNHQDSTEPYSYWKSTNRLETKAFYVVAYMKPKLGLSTVVRPAKNHPVLTSREPRKMPWQNNHDQRQLSFDICIRWSRRYLQPRADLPRCDKSLSLFLNSWIILRLFFAGSLLV